MPRPTHVRTIGCLVLLVLLVAGCSSAAPQAASPKSTRSDQSASAPASTPGRSSASARLSAPADRCGPPEDRQATTFTLHGRGRATMPAVEVGTGTTFAVLLHQSDGDGMCGFWPFADWLARKHHVHVVLFDLCGYGKSDCTDRAYSDDQAAQVAVAVRWARGRGATRVALVGASMGGALALATAPATRADAVVDLSGPDWWPHADAEAAAKRIAVPTLVAVSQTDTNTSYAILRSAFADIPVTKKLFVKGDGPHGWDLLSDDSAGTVHWLPLATTVARWIASP